MPELQDNIFQYMQRFPDGHPLKDIAITTIKELNRENPFDRNKPKTGVRNLNIMNAKTTKHFNSIEDACTNMGLSLFMVKYDIQQVLDKYGLRLI